MARAAAGDVAEKVKANFLSALPVMNVPAPSTVAGYWPMGDEVDVCPLLHHLFDQGWECGLPVVTGREKPLVFRRWHPGLDLDDGEYGTRHPGAGQPEVMPVVVLVPLLAFDGRGNRVGYGGGYYDRTLLSLRETGLSLRKTGLSPRETGLSPRNAGESMRPVVAVGVAFAGQWVDHVPHGFLDQRLDWVVTEREALKVFT